MTDWTEATDPVPGKKRKPLYPYTDAIGHQNYKRMAVAAAVKRREAKAAQECAVDFSKPYRAKGA